MCLVTDKHMNLSGKYFMATVMVSVGEYCRMKFVYGGDTSCQRVREVKPGAAIEGKSLLHRLAT